jgi:hypothetical protein
MGRGGSEVVRLEEFSMTDLIEDAHDVGCVECYAALRAYHVKDHPDIVTMQLNIIPELSAPIGSDTPLGMASEQSVWVVSSVGQVDSRRIQDHIEWILDLLDDVRQELGDLQRSGWAFDLMCPWTHEGFGGPSLDHACLARLASFELDIWFPIDVVTSPGPA